MKLSSTDKSPIDKSTQEKHEIVRSFLPLFVYCMWYLFRWSDWKQRSKATAGVWTHIRLATWNGKTTNCRDFSHVQRSNVQRWEPLKLWNLTARQPDAYTCTCTVRPVTERRFQKKYTGGFSWGVWGRRWAKNPVI
jgi:hypothetical protein